MISDCIGVSDAIWNLAHDGTELTEEELRHARSCNFCAEMLAEAQAAVAALGCVKPYPPAPDCRQRVMSRIDGIGRVTGFRRLAWATVPIAVAVALLMALYCRNPERAVRRPEVSRQPALTQPWKQEDNMGLSALARKVLNDTLTAKGGLRPIPRPDPTSVTLAVPKSERATAKANPVEVVAKGAGEPTSLRPPVDGPREDTTSASAAGAEFHGGSPGCSPRRGLDVTAAELAGEGVQGPSAEQIAFRQMLQSKIERAAALISDASNGGSRLVMKSGASVDSGGHAFRMGKWGNLPLASVYPVSRPVDTHIPGFGFGRILGAAALLGYEEPGVYLVFAPVPAGSGSQPRSVVLLSPGVDTSRTAFYKAHAESALVEHTTSASTSFPHVSLSYDDAAIAVQMDWPQESYGFSLEGNVVFP